MSKVDGVARNIVIRIQLKLELNFVLRSKLSAAVAAFLSVTQCGVYSFWHRKYNK